MPINANKRENIINFLIAHLEWWWKWNVGRTPKKIPLIEWLISVLWGGETFNTHKNALWNLLFIHHSSLYQHNFLIFYIWLMWVCICSSKLQNEKRDINFQDQFEFLMNWNTPLFLLYNSWSHKKEFHLTFLS